MVLSTLKDSPEGPVGLGWLGFRFGPGYGLATYCTAAERSIWVVLDDLIGEYYEFSAHPQQGL
jgi:hypothetical protein